VLALADDNSPAFVALGMNAFASMFIDMQKIAEAFRGDGALSWGDHHPCLFSGTEWLYTASSTMCTPLISLSREVGLGLGAQAGEARLRQVLRKPGSRCSAGRRRRR
jgi:hypothetical protein